MPETYVAPNPLTGRYEDAVHRICDDVNIVLAHDGPDAIGDWMIFGLADGKPAMDNAAWKHKRYPSPWWAIMDWKSLRPAILVKIPVGAAKPHDIAVWLKMNRQAYDNGYRIQNGTYDPSNVIREMPLNRENLR